MTTFLIIAGLMTAALLAYLLLPWLRRSGDKRLKALDQALAAGVLTRAEYEEKSAQIAAEPAPAAGYAGIGRRQAVAIAVLVPVVAFLIYGMIGRPDALNTMQPAGLPAATADKAAGPIGMDMPKAIENLKTKLAKNPEDADGWLLLGRAYKSVENNTDALDALKKAYTLSPERPDIQIAYAEAMALLTPSRRIEGEPLRLIKLALASEPMNQDGLWLLGMSDYQNGRYAEAVVSWEKIREQLPPDSDVLANVNGMIDDANAILSGKPPVMTAQGSAPAAVSGGASLTVNVALAPEHSGRIKPGDTLFVYAKAASGPPMPIAIQKLLASDLPATVVLTDGMGMTPTMNLSQFPQVVVIARISPSGNAIPQKGDLQAVSGTIDIAASKAVNLSINQVVK